MSKLADLNKPDNLYLFDLLFRHQVYLEGVKAGFAVEYRKMLNSLYDEFAKYFGRTEYDTLDSFTRIELQQFIYRFTQAQHAFYNRYTQQLIDLLKQFVATDVEVSNAIYKAVIGTSVTTPLKPSTMPLAHTDGSEEGNAALWATITDTIVPANGLTVPEMLNQFAQTSSTKVAQAINQAYANGDKMREALAAIVGNRSNNFRDGLFATFSNQNNAIIATIIQHASSILQAGIASNYFDEYQWVAILDSRTTSICRSRDGNIYVYGEGPLPPAHWFCRSKAVSLTVDGEAIEVPDTFYDWLTTQPDEVIADMLGQSIAASIIARDPKMKDISVTDSVIPLTLAAFGMKIDFITL